MLVGDRLGYVLSALFAITTALTAMISPTAPARAQVADRRVLRDPAPVGIRHVMLASRRACHRVLGIETLSIGVYVMTAMRRTSAAGNEAAMKYFLIGASRPASSCTAWRCSTARRARCHS